MQSVRSSEVQTWGYYVPTSNPGPRDDLINILMKYNHRTDIKNFTHIFCYKDNKFLCFHY